jgi:hypothetical protein
MSFVGNSLYVWAEQPVGIAEAEESTEDIAT